MPPVPDPDLPPDDPDDAHAPDEDGLEPNPLPNATGFLFALADTELRLADDWHPVGVASLHTTGSQELLSLEFLPGRADADAMGFDDLSGPGVWIELCRADAHRLKRALDRLL